MVAALLHSVLLIFIVTVIGVVSAAELQAKSTTALLGLLYGVWVLQYLVLIRQTRGGISARPLQLLLVAAVVARVIFAYAPVVLTGDLPRYLWEGHLIRHGFNPYLYAPAHSALEGLRTTYWHFIEYPDLSAIYPPVAQYFLAFFARSVTVWKLFLVVVELCNLWLLTALLRRYHLPPERVLWYAFLPLVLLEISLSGHLEGLLITFTLGALFAALSLLDKVAAAEERLIDIVLLAFLFAAGTLIKYVFVLVAVIFTVRNLRALKFYHLATLTLFTLFFGLIFTLPFVRNISDVQHLFASLETYLTHWRFNDSLLHLAGYLLGVSWDDIRTFYQIKWALTGIWLASVAALVYARMNWVRLIAVSYGLYLCTSAVVHPWYGLWFVPFIIIEHSRALLCFALLLPLAYLSLLSGSSEQMWLLKPVEYLPVLLLLARELWPVFRERLAR